MRHTQIIASAPREPGAKNQCASRVHATDTQMSRFFRVAVDKIAVEWLLLDRFLEAAMIASESTEFTLDRTERFSCNALQEALDTPAQIMPDGGATLRSSSSGAAFRCVPTARL